MPPFRPVYRVARIAAPVLGRRGALVGVPCVEIRLSPAGGPGVDMGLDAVVREVNALFPPAPRPGSEPPHGQMPRWVWLAGDPSPHAHDLVVGCQVLLKRLVYVETDGLRPMGDLGKLPLYDHVAVVVPKLPVDRIATELFHSVVAPLPVRAAHLDGLDRFLSSVEYNGHRFLVASGPLTERDMRVLAPHARLWRISGGPVPHPGVRCSPAFASPLASPRPRPPAALPQKGSP